MSYMTMKEQLASHLAFLKVQCFAVDEIHVDVGFIRCHLIGHSDGRGEVCYQSKKTKLKNGLIGLSTWVRIEAGQEKIHKTYGSHFVEISPNTSIKNGSESGHKAIEKAESFWQMSEQTGEAEYLLKKGVGYYGIRFRHNEYGKVAVIPMRDISERLYSYQIINPDGTKRYAKDVEIKCLLHMLQKPIDGLPIGLAESYVTAATCFELTGIAMVTAFSANNLKPVGMALRAKFRNSPIIVFGDNHLHLLENKGKLAADGVKNELGITCQVIIPDFNGYPTTKEFSDWNDLVREVGVWEARRIMAASGYST